jgi:DNA-binding beta-propeller fold protein YncE
MRKRLRHFGILFAALSHLVACAVQNSQDIFLDQGKVWPDPPEVARIAFVVEFSNPSDLNIDEGFWRRLVSVASGPLEKSMLRPMDVAVTSDGNTIFVADPDANCVHRYDLEKARYRCLASGKKDQPASPVALAISREGRLFVSDSQSGRLLFADPDAQTLKVFPVSVPLNRPTGMHWDDESARLFVTDTVSHSVKVFDALGNLKDEFGGRGNAPGDFNFPTYLWVDAGGDILVTDSLNFRVQRFGRDGNFKAIFGKNGDRPGDFSRPKGIAAYGNGQLYVTDALFHAIQIFSPDGQLLINIGKQGQGEGEFWLPNGIFITVDNTIFVADSFNKRVQVFRYIGPDS